MYLEKIALSRYRNYELLQKEFTARINILIGPNAQGKTNLLEAIYYLAVGKTYRPAQDPQLVKWAGSSFAIKGNVINRQGQLKVEINYRLNEQNNKEIKLNGLKINKMADLLGNLTVVLFAPEDLNIIKGAPVERRRLLDSDISQVSPSYFLKLQRYNRLLNQRNHLLKLLQERRKPAEDLEIWNHQFLEAGAEIISKRIQVLEKLSPLTRLLQRKLTSGQENLEMKYLLNRQDEIRQGQDIRSLLAEEMRKRKDEEIRRGQTLWGPHRDDLALVLNGNDLKFYGSQGQHRTAVLALKLAELEFFRAETGEYPVLLLDDVMSELDPERREQLIRAIQDKEIQSFITTTEDISSMWHDQARLSKYQVRCGEII